MNGIFITFEGNDGSGKSTQIKFLSQCLMEEGYDVLLTREPGGCKISEKLRDILLDAENNDLSPLTELLIYEAARAQHMHQVILPALTMGKIVICDRFTDSTTAYQGYGRGLDLAQIKTLNDVAVQGRYPDITILLNLDPEHSFLRKGGVDQNDRIEQEGLAFHKRVYEGYMALAAENPNRIITLDVAKNTKYQTADIIYSLIKERLGR